MRLQDAADATSHVRDMLGEHALLELGDVDLGATLPVDLAVATEEQTSPFRITGVAVVAAAREAPHAGDLDEIHEVPVPSNELLAKVPVRSADQACQSELRQPRPIFCAELPRHVADGLAQVIESFLSSQLLDCVHVLPIFQAPILSIRSGLDGTSTALAARQDLGNITRFQEICL